MYKGSLTHTYVLETKKAQNIDAGTFTSGAWRTRDINDEHADTAGICSIASNQITLAKGTYRCLIFCPTMQVHVQQARLYNVTDAAVLLVGHSAYRTAVDQGSFYSWIAGRFTLDDVKTLEIQHICNTTRATVGFGIAADFGEEIFTSAEFWREV